MPQPSLGHQPRWEKPHGSSRCVGLLQSSWLPTMHFNLTGSPRHIPQRCSCRRTWVPLLACPQSPPLGLVAPSVNRNQKQAGKWDLGWERSEEMMGVCRLPLQPDHRIATHGQGLSASIDRPSPPSPETPWSQSRREGDQLRVLCVQMGPHSLGGAHPTWSG